MLSKMRFLNLTSLFMSPLDMAFGHLLARGLGVRGPARRSGTRTKLFVPRRIVLFAIVGLACFGILKSRMFVAQQEQIVIGTEFGDPLSGITPKEFELFRSGLENFTEVETPDEGLGPVFNGRSCAECHSVPRIGGSSTITEVRCGIRREDGSFEEYPG